MKKEIIIAVTATILILQVVGGFFGGAVQQVADGISARLSTRIHLTGGE